MGDNNYQPGSPVTGNPDQAVGLSELVEPAWILGVARGMIPWYGSLKLLLQGTTSEVPSQSWTFMGLSFASLVLIAWGIHLAIRRYEDRRERRRRGEAPPPDLPEAFWNRLTRPPPRSGAARRTDEEGDGGSEPPARSAPSKKTKHVHIDPHKLSKAGSGRPEADRASARPGRSPPRLRRRATTRSWTRRTTTIRCSETAFPSASSREYA